MLFGSSSVKVLQNGYGGLKVTFFLNIWRIKGRNVNIYDGPYNLQSISQTWLDLIGAQMPKHSMGHESRRENINKHES